MEEIVGGSVTKDMIAAGAVTKAKLAPDVFATTSEVAAATATDTAVSPATLSHGVATVLTTATASQADAEAGTNPNKIMTPQRTAQAIAAQVNGGSGATAQLIYYSSSKHGNYIDCKGYSAVFVRMITNSSTRSYIPMGLHTNTSGGRLSTSGGRYVGFKDGSFQHSRAYHPDTSFYYGNTQYVNSTGIFYFNFWGLDNPDGGVVEAGCHLDGRSTDHGYFYATVPNASALRYVKAYDPHQGFYVWGIK